MATYGDLVRVARTLQQAGMTKEAERIVRELEAQLGGDDLGLGPDEFQRFNHQGLSREKQMQLKEFVADKVRSEIDSPDVDKFVDMALRRVDLFTRRPESKDPKKMLQFLNDIVPMVTGEQSKMDLGELMSPHQQGMDSLDLLRLPDLDDEGFTDRMSGLLNLADALDEDGQFEEARRVTASVVGAMRRGADLVDDLAGLVPVGRRIRYHCDKCENEEVFEDEQEAEEAGWGSYLEDYDGPRVSLCPDCEYRRMNK